MKVNDRQFDPSKFMDNMQKRNAERLKKIEQKKEQLKQKILVDWNEHESRVFWNQCFQKLTLTTIQQTYDLIEGLVKSGYPVINRAALFISQLKKMGFYPWPAESGEKGKNTQGGKT